MEPHDAANEKLRVPASSWFNMLIGAGDFLTDLAFAKLVVSQAYFRCPADGDGCGALNSTLVVNGGDLETCPVSSTLGGLHCAPPACGGVDRSQCCPRLCGDRCDAPAEVQTYAWLAIVFVLLPLGLSFSAVLHYAFGVRWARGRPSCGHAKHTMIDNELWRRRPLFHIIVSVMSLTNLEVLRMLPWRKTTYDGLPTQRMLGLTFLVTFCEDVPQLILQFAYIFHGAALLGIGPLDDPLPLLSAAITLISLIWRSFRKLVLALYSSDMNEMSSDRSSHFAPSLSLRGLRRAPKSGKAKAPAASPMQREVDDDYDGGYGDALALDLDEITSLTVEESSGLRVDGVGVDLDEITSVTVEESSGLRVDDDGRPSRASQWSKALPVHNDHHAERLARARYAARLARARAAIGAAKPGDDEAVKTYVALATVAEQASRVTRSRESASLALVQRWSSKVPAAGAGDHAAAVEESSGLRVDGDDGELVRTWTMAKPGADRVSAIAAEEQLVRTLTLKKPEALQRAADAFLAEGGDDDDLLGEAPFRESFRPGAARDFRADRLARARYAARMARARAHLGEARSGDATLVSQWLDLKYEGEAADEWKEKEREKFLAAESARDDDDDDDDDDDLNPDGGRHRRVTTTTTTRSLDCASTAAACRRRRRTPNAPSA